jgi:hypothetical protein
MTFHAHRKCPDCGDPHPLTGVELKTVQDATILLTGAFAASLLVSVVGPWALGVKALSWGWGLSVIFLIAIGVTGSHLAFLRLFRGRGAFTEEGASWVRLLLERGYRFDQLIYPKGDASPGFSQEKVSEAADLIQNPYGIDLSTPAMIREIKIWVKNGYLPHHLGVFQDGSLYLDNETADLDCMRVAREVNRASSTRLPADAPAPRQR